MGKMLRCLAKFYGFVTLPFPCALLAQLDRASDYESEGRWFESSRAHQFFPVFFTCFSCYWRVGRVAEGDGLLNRYTVKICIGGSNPPLSAIIIQDVPLIGGSNLCLRMQAQAIRGIPHSPP